METRGEGSNLVFLHRERALYFHRVLFLITYKHCCPKMRCTNVGMAHTITITESALTVKGST